MAVAEFLPLFNRPTIRLAAAKQANRLVMLMGSRDLGGWYKDAVTRIVLDELTRVRKGGR